MARVAGFGTELHVVGSWTKPAHVQREVPRGQGNVPCDGLAFGHNVSRSTCEAPSKRCARSPSVGVQSLKGPTQRASVARRKGVGKEVEAGSIGARV